MFIRRGLYQKVTGSVEKLKLAACGRYVQFPGGCPAPAHHAVLQCVSHHRLPVYAVQDYLYKVGITTQPALANKPGSNCVRNTVRIAGNAVPQTGTVTLVPTSVTKSNVFTEVHVHRWALLHINRGNGHGDKMCYKSGGVQSEQSCMPN